MLLDTACSVIALLSSRSAELMGSSFVRLRRASTLATVSLVSFSRPFLRGSCFPTRFSVGCLRWCDQRFSFETTRTVVSRNKSITNLLKDDQPTKSIEFEAIKFDILWLDVGCRLGNRRRPRDIFQAANIYSTMMNYSKGQRQLWQFKPNISDYSASSSSVLFDRSLNAAIAFQWTFQLPSGWWTSFPLVMHSYLWDVTHSSVFIIIIFRLLKRNKPIGPKLFP